MDITFAMATLATISACISLVFSICEAGATRRAKALEERINALWDAHALVAARHAEEIKRVDGASVGLKARVSSLEKKSASLSKQIKDEGVARFSGEALQKGWMSDIRARVRALETGESDGFVFPEDGFGMDLAMEQECAKASSKAKAPKVAKTAKPAGRSKNGGA